VAVRNLPAHGGEEFAVGPGLAQLVEQ
jgi:hypothetical protein